MGRTFYCDEERKKMGMVTVTEYAIMHGLSRNAVYSAVTRRRLASEFMFGRYYIQKDTPFVPYDQYREENEFKYHSPQCLKCKYWRPLSAHANKENTPSACHYILDENHSRGCSALDCNKFVKRKRIYKKNED